MSALPSETDHLIVTPCHGGRYWLALGPWVAHIAALEKCPIEIVSLDGGQYKGGVSSVTTFMADAAPAELLRYEPTFIYRLERILFHLAQGRTCIQIDLDVRMKRDFSALCSLPYDFIVSREFGSPGLAVERLGFVAGCGFYIAKPSARRLCAAWLDHIRRKTYGTDMDQNVLNLMLCDVGSPTRQTISFGNLVLQMDVLELAGCRIGVLPKEAIERNLEIRASVFGNHHRGLIDRFLIRSLPEHPAKVLRELISTSPIGPTAIRLRNRLRAVIGGSSSIPAGKG
jgi:hypothetical protein